MPTTLFDAPSPSGRNAAKLYLNSKGQLFDRHGNNWGRSSIATMAQDAALKPRRKLAYDDNETSPSAKRDAPRGQEDLARLRAAIKELALATGHDDGDYQKMLDNVLGRRRADGGANATDEDADADADVEEQVREYLASKGLADDDVEEAIQKVRADRKAARDSRPQPATRGGFGGRFSGATKDVDLDYPNNFVDMPDYSPDPNRFAPHYDPLKMRDLAARLPGGGVSRRLSNDAAIEATDEQMETAYPGFLNVTVGY